MARRAKSGIKLTHIILALIALVAIAGGGWVALNHSNDEFAGVTHLDVRDYYENANSLRGNVYKFTGTVDKLIKWSPDEGRLFSIIAKNEEGDVSDPVGVLIPEAFSGENLQRGDEFIFQIEVGREGILIVQDMLKV